MTIENDGGTWASLAPATGVGVDKEGRAAFWLDGQSGYEGMSAFMVQTLEWQGQAPYWSFEGWIVPGEARLTAAST